MRNAGRCTRRAFLKAAAAAAAAPSVIASSTWGAAGALPPSERLHVGFIGVGGQGGGHLTGGPWSIQGGFVARGDVHVPCVCDVDARTRNAAKHRVEQAYAAKFDKDTYKGCDAYNDFREVLGRRDVDAVLIGTPDHWHAIISCEAARAGKDVYCEKPMTRDVREGRIMVETIRRTGCVFQVGTQQRSSQYFQLALAMLRRGLIGKVKTVHVGVGGPSTPLWRPAVPVPEGFDWDFWLGPAPWRPFNPAYHPAGFRNCRDFSGGGMTDWGAHHFDIAQWGLEMDGSGPVEIYPPDGKDFSTLTYRYASGVWMYHGGANGILFTGTDGKIEVNRGYLRTWPDSLRLHVVRGNEQFGRGSLGHAGNWIECVRTRQDPVTPVEVGHRSVSVCHLGNIAYWLGRPLKWDPVREDFIGDPAASRWLDRPKRAPWRLDA